MQRKTLVILAAGLGSRYKDGIKQLKSFGPDGETILDYSIYDAIRSGFTELVLIIRRDIEQLVLSHLLPRWENKIAIRFVFQELQSYTENFSFHPERQKPWGTAHALLCAKDEINTPFIIINADDFYGRESFQLAAKMIDKQYHQEFYGIICYQLSQTLSEHGAVNRGICKIDEKENLLSIKECIGITKNAGGRIRYMEESQEYFLDALSPASMNFFVFSTHIFNYAQKDFLFFLQHNGMELKTEFFIPKLVQNLIEKYGKSVQTIQTQSKWFGVTYQEDNESIRTKITDLITKNLYPNPLG